MTIPLLSPAGPTDAAAPSFSSCDKLTRAWPSGVAKGPVAANKAVRDGYSRPATGPRAVAVYWENHCRLDRDHDGTACDNGWVSLFTSGSGWAALHVAEPVHVRGFTLQAGRADDRQLSRPRIRPAREGTLVPLQTVVNAKVESYI
jgi:hypothetical protein